MSEIRVDTITEKTSGSGTTVSNLKNPNQPFRNLIINGDMNIWQRATAATTATDGGYNTVDRWHNVFFSTAGAMTSEREALSVADQATTGMYYCNLLKCTTADTSIATNSVVGFRQTIEAQNCQSLNYGTSAAKNVTISFYAKANASKTYSLNLWKRDSTTYYWFKDISVTDSWQKFTYTISPTAGSTSLITSSGGAIANDNGEGLELTFILVAGTNYDGTADTWQDSGSDAQHFYDGSIDNFLSSTDNTLRITGVQLEVGEVATDFEHLPFDVQLQRCMRYCQKWDFSDANNILATGRTLSSNRVDLWYQHKVPTRAAIDAITDGLTTVKVYKGDGIVSGPTQTATALVAASAEAFGVRKTYSETITADRLAGTQLGGTLIATCEL